MTSDPQEGQKKPILSGPYVKTALFCERVLDEKDGVLSLVRVVDQFTVSASGPAAPKQMPPISQRLQAVIMLISGTAKGPEDVKLEVEKPNGMREEVWTGTAHMEGDHKSVNLVFNFQAAFELTGVYWFSVFVGEELLTRMPLEIRYTRFSAGTASKA